MLLALAITAIALVPATPARAGGAVMQPDRSAYLPGEVAIVYGSFSKNGAYEGTLADGPYIAYLLPVGAWIEGTRVPDVAIALGELVIGHPTDSSYPRAAVRFAVPEVPAGLYHVEYCNDPCTVEGIGDLMGSSEFAIAATRLEAASIRRIDRLEERIGSVRRSAHRRERNEQAKLERELDARTDDLEMARSRVVGLEAQLARLRDQGDERSPVPGWGIVLISTALVAAAFIVRRARRSSVEVPDTIPPELVDRERLEV